jgi:hypothetical protein
MTEDNARLHTHQQHDTPLGHTHPDRCLYTCYRQNTNSCELVQEKAHYQQLRCHPYGGFLLVIFGYSRILTF